MRGLTSLLVILCLAFLANGCGIKSEKYWYNNISTDGYQQESRIGRNFLSTVFAANDAVLGALNNGDPATDDAKLKPLLESAITSMRDVTDGFVGTNKKLLADAAATAGLLSPDVLRLTVQVDKATMVVDNTNAPDEADGFDAILQTVFGNAQLNDGLDLTLVRLHKTFPYLRKPKK